MDSNARDRTMPNILQEGDDKLLKEQGVQVVHLQMVKEKQIYYGGESIGDSKRAAALIKEFLGEVDRECVVVCATDVRMKPTHIQIVGMGTVNYCPVYIPEIFKMALLSNAVGILLFHNHPSGDCTPSNEDIYFTERVMKAGNVLGIQLIDHIILGEGGDFYSLRESGSTLRWDSIG